MVSLACMRCYHCAEEIRSESTLCRYCHQPVTSANRLGLPSWYTDTGAHGLSLLWIQRDVETYALGDCGNFICLNGHNPVDQAWSITPHEEEWELFRRVVSAIYRRLGEIGNHPGVRLERSFLILLVDFYRIFNDLLNAEEMVECWSPSNLRSLQGSLRHALSSADIEALPERLRDEFTNLFTEAVDTLEKYIVRRG